MGKKWFSALVKKIFVCQSKEKVKGSQRVISLSPKAPSHRIVSAQAQATTSQRIPASPIVMIKKESKSTLRDYHVASAIKIQASFRGYMVRRHFGAMKGLLVHFQGEVQQPRVKRQMTTNAMKITHPLVRVESQNNQALESFKSESTTQARQYQNRKQVSLNLLDQQLHPDQPFKNYRLTHRRMNSSLKSPSINNKQLYPFLPTSSKSSVLMSSKQLRTPTLGRMLQGSNSSSVNKYSRSRASHIPNYMAPTISSKAKVNYWFFQDTRWQGV